MGVARTVQQIPILIIGVNNFHKLTFHFNTTKKSTIKNFNNEVSKENLNKLFAKVITDAGSLIEKLINQMTWLSFEDIKREKIPMLFKESWQSDPVSSILVTVNDYTKALSPAFKNQVHAKVYLRRMIEHYFMCYFQYFVWIVANAFHKDNILTNFKPSILKLEIEKEANRKDIQSFIRRSEVVKPLLAKDAETFKAFFATVRDLLSENFVVYIDEECNYIRQKLSNSGYQSAHKFEPRELDEAIAFLRDKLR